MANSSDAFTSKWKSTRRKIRTPFQINVAFSQGPIVFSSCFIKSQNLTSCKFNPLSRQGPHQVSLRAPVMADNAASNHAEFHEKKTIEKWIVLYFVSNKNRAISSSMAKTSLIYAYLYLLVGLASNQLDIWSGRHNFESLKNSTVKLRSGKKAT